MEKLLVLGDVTVKRVAFGAEQLGGFDWGNVDIEAIEGAAIRAAGTGNIFFDTADCYGHGESERRLGRILGAFRNKSFLSTKFGVRFDAGDRVYYDNDPEYAEVALEASLRRLRTDYVDLLQVHWPDNHTPLPRLFERLERLRADGRIRWYGVSNFPYSQLQELPDQWPGFATFSGQFNLLHRGDENLIGQLSRKTRLVFLSWGSLAQGLLSGKYGRDSRFGPNDRRARKNYENFHGEGFIRNLRVVERLTAISSRTGAHSPAQLAIRFVLDAIPNSVAIVGVKSAEQFDDSMKALSATLDHDSLRELAEASRTA